MSNEVAACINTLMCFRLMLYGQSNQSDVL